MRTKQNGGKFLKASELNEGVVMITFPRDRDEMGSCIHKTTEDIGRRAELKSERTSDTHIRKTTDYFKALMVSNFYPNNSHANLEM
jgi:hypothetical protein